MRVVWAAASGGLQRGGFIPALERTGSLLLARGDSLDVVVPDVGEAAWHGELRARGIGVHAVRNDPWSAARRVASLRGDVVHAHFHDWLVAVTLATWPTRARLLWHLHSAFETDTVAVRVNPRRRLKFRALGARAAAFVCVTETIAAGARALGADPRKIVVVPNAVDAARFFPADAATRAAARARLGIDGAPAIAFFGRDPGIKGADVLRGALERLDGVTVVAVAAPQSTVDDLARRARVVNVPFTDDVREVLWAVDAVAMPSRGEGMPFVALEALACGVPVVAATCRGRPSSRSAAARSRSRAARMPRTSRPCCARRSTRRPLPLPAPGDDLDAWARRIVSLYARAGMV